MPITSPLRVRRRTSGGRLVVSHLRRGSSSTLLACALSAALVPAPTLSAQRAASSGSREVYPGKGAVAGRRGMVVSSSNYASDIGAAMLARGGNAIDAAVATAFALAVTHPSAGNIGGGGFMVVRMATGEATTFDFREKAPLTATPTMFQTADGAIAYARTDSGWLSPGVPGTVRGLEAAHKRFGKLPWRTVVLPAAQLAARGFRLSRALAADLNEQVKTTFAPFPASLEAYGKRGGTAWRAGDLLRLPDLARSLRAIADSGADVFYTGWIADSLAAQMQEHGGAITARDLAEYQAVERAPVRGYVPRQRHHRHGAAEFGGRGPHRDAQPARGAQRRALRPQPARIPAPADRGRTAGLPRSCAFPWRRRLRERPDRTPHLEGLRRLAGAQHRPDPRHPLRRL